MQTNGTNAMKPVLALNRSKLDELRRANGVKSEADLARRLGVDSSTLYRVSTGKSIPSNEFMAGLKAAFPLCSLDDLFNLTMPTAPAPLDAEPALAAEAVAR